MTTMIKVRTKGTLVTRMQTIVETVTMETKMTVINLEENVNNNSCI